MEEKSSGKLIYPDLSYRIVGCLYNVYNNLGPNHKEKIYQNALSEELKIAKLKFKEQVYYNLKYKDRFIGKVFFDFLIDGKIVLEIKSSRYFKKKDFEQVLGYLKASNLKLAIIACFTKDKVKTYRVLN